MYISGIHIHGFKSFYFKTDLEFGRGITSVVGPNGSGKSNIVDALRWILGEQKTSVLRSTRMEDVIFNGSRHRKALSFCEVSIDIANDKGILPAEFDEVQITRRFYRSGDSEYLLNNTPCRLKDIMDLILDTGLGSNAYSILELKMIDSLLSPNPAERRKLFEEAAGINHYKISRHSSFNKLELTRSDMSRVKDIMLEVEKLVKNLGLQVKRLKRHEKLSKQLREDSLLLAKIQHQFLEEKLYPLSEDMAELSTDVQKNREDIAHSEKMRESSKNEFLELKEELETVRHRNKDLAAELRNRNNDLLVWTEQKKSNELRIKQYLDEDKQNAERIETMKRQRDEIAASLEKIRPELHHKEIVFQEEESELKGQSAVFENISASHQQNRNSLDALNREIFQKELMIQKEENQLKELDQQRQNLSARKDNLLGARNVQDSELSDLKAQISKKEKEISERGLALDALKEDLQNTESEWLELREQFLSRQSELKGLKEQAAFYSAIYQKHEGKLPGARYILQNADAFPGLLGALSDLLRVEDSNRDALALALGESADYLLVEDLASAQKIIEKIRQQGKHSIALFVLSEVPKFSDFSEIPEESLFHKVTVDEAHRSLFAHLLGNCFLEDDAPNAFPENGVLLHENGQTRQGFVLKYQSQNTESNIGRKKQIDDYKKKIADLDAETKGLGERSRAIEREQIQNLKTRIKNENKELDAALNKRMAIERDLNRKQFQIKQNREDLLAIDGQFEENSDRKIKSDVELKKLTVELQELQKRHSSEKQQFDAQSSELEEIQLAVDALKQNAQDAKIQLISTEKEKEGIEFRQSTIQQQLLDTEERMASTSAERKVLGEQLDGLSEKIAETEASRNSLAEKQALFNRELGQLERKYDIQYAAMEALQRKLEEQSKIRELKLQKIQEMEIKKAGYEKDIELIQQRIWEQFEEKIATSTLNLAEQDAETLENGIAKNRKSLQNIGAVNMEAGKEFDAENQRLEFLHKQYSDLEESEKTLLSTIRRLDKEARARFSDTFQAIAQNFEKTYKMFYEGGEARLELVGSDDPLDAEIEIFARPPGKRSHNLRVLSAGEKALTAISLLFAIYLVKPSPFCILDEIDAPLDDKNIQKFSKVLHQFSTNTQFIVVTHNKLTMEASDYLFGVTQEEKGVSKIVSVRMNSDA